MILHFLIAAAAAGAAHSHSVTLDHAGAPVALRYQATTSIAHRQIGAAGVPGRPSSQRCLWTATVAVDRSAERGGVTVPALSRRVSAAERLEGSRPGSCTQARKAVAREVADRAAPIRDHLIEVAERDRAAVLAELESVEALAGRRG